MQDWQDHISYTRDDNLMMLGVVASELFVAAIINAILCREIENEARNVLCKGTCWETTCAIKLYNGSAVRGIVIRKGRQISRTWEIGCRSVSYPFPRYWKLPIYHWFGEFSIAGLRYLIIRCSMAQRGFVIQYSRISNLWERITYRIGITTVLIDCWKKGENFVSDG